LQTFLEKLKEAVFSVLPVVVLIFICQLFGFINLNGNEILLLLSTSVTIILGICFFTVGAEISIATMGEQVGSGLTKKNRLALLVIICFLLGVLITIAEPDLQVLAKQCANVIGSTELILMIGLGVGIFLAIGIIKMILKKDLGQILMFFYFFAFALASIVLENGNGALLPLAFDSGGVTTGPITVPFLMALGVELPKKVLGHPWLLQGGEKMSKSKGNVLYFDDLASIFGVDSVRYYSLKELSLYNDGTITWELLCERNNTDLSNILGNLVKRTLGMSNQYFGGKIINYNIEENIDCELKDLAKSTSEKVFSKLNEYKASEALEELWALFRRANKYIDETEPWNLNKDETKKERLSTVLYNLLESINIGANILACFMPETANKIFNELNVEARNFGDFNKFGLIDNYSVTNNPQILFNRIKMDDIKPMIDEIVAKQKAENAPTIEFKQADFITIDDFAKVQLKIGEVVECEAVPKSKLLHSKVKVGNKFFSILSGIGKQYSAEEMVGKKVVLVTNLPPREMKGFMSEGMIICAEDEQGNLSLLSPERPIPDGSNVC